MFVNIMYSLIFLMSLAHLISALPGGAQITEAPLARKYATPVKRDDVCGRDWKSECFLGTWSAGPECTETAWISTIVSQLVNPPATETAYTPTAYCSEVLQQTSTPIVRVTYSATSTISQNTYIYNYVTETDYDHPTSTVWCPKPSQSQVCGIEFHGTIYATDMQPIWPQDTIRFVDVNTYHQRCLGDAACHSFLIQGSSSGGDIIDCSLFGANLGINGTRAEHPPTPLATPSGKGWYDRNCPEFLPTECEPQQQSLAPRTEAPKPRDPMITASPVPQAVDDAALEKRYISYFPDYLSSGYAWAGGYFLTWGCSCLITSALPETTSTSTVSIPVWLGTVSTTSTHYQEYTVTVTARTTTVYPSID
ncbi:hypothetical protein V501_07160 [Pseudogymnoascus sp. VKM F-4519 (FW-2642)]|nr:hypothetical protein V501_07160 [Pseudogymnoascus sp. VKM F-4519 (FW-2642)]